MSIEGFKEYKYITFNSSVFKLYLKLNIVVHILLREISQNSKWTIVIVLRVRWIIVQKVSLYWKKIRVSFVSYINQVKERCKSYNRNTTHNGSTKKEKVFIGKLRDKCQRETQDADVIIFIKISSCSSYFANGRCGWGSETTVIKPLPVQNEGTTVAVLLQW